MDRDLGRHFKGGFTIIETMLVLAISGALVVALLISIGGSINVQRYRDSVISLKALIQDQYSALDNVSNEHDTTWSCGATATPVQGGVTSAQGQSDCVLLGRYMAIVDGDVTTASVVGFGSTSGTASNDVVGMVAGYTFGISSVSIARDALEWGTKIAWPVSGGGSGSKPAGSPRSIAILMVRSPSTGSTYTFTSDTVVDINAVNSAVIKAMMVDDASAIPGRSARSVCVDSNGLIVPEQLAVYIRADASGPSSIETRSHATSQANGGDVQC